MAAPSTGTFNVNTCNESTANNIPASSDTAPHVNTVNSRTSNINAVGRDQYNNTYQTNYYSNIPRSTTAGPSSSGAVSFNDAPHGLLSAHFASRQDELAQMIKASEVDDSQGRYRDAEVLYKQVLSNMKKRLGPEHAKTLTTTSTMAGGYDSQMRYRDAEVLYKQVLSSLEKELGPEHDRTLATMENLALVYNSQGRYQDAKALFKQVLSSRERQLGLEHVDTLATKHNLAGVYDSQGRYRDAEVLFKQALSSLEKQLGPDHATTLTTKHCLASVYYSQGRHAEAEALLRDRKMVRTVASQYAKLPASTCEGFHKPGSAR